MSEAGDRHTRVDRSFLWEEPEDPDVAESLRQMMEAMVVAGEGAIKSVFEDLAARS